MKIDHIQECFSQGWGNSIMVSLSICEVDRPGSSLAQSVCYRKVEIYQHIPTSANNWFTKGRSMFYHVYVIMHVKDL